MFLHVHDPAVDKLPSEWTTNVTRYNHPEESIQYADAIVVATEWPEYREISLNKLSSLKNSILMVDSNRFLQKFSGVDMIEYAAVGAPHNEIKL